MCGRKICMARATNERNTHCPGKNGVNYVSTGLESIAVLDLVWIWIWTGTKITPFLKGLRFLKATHLDCVSPLCPFSPSECITTQTCMPLGRNCRRACFLGGTPSPAVPSCVGPQPASALKHLLLFPQYHVFFINLCCELLFKLFCTLLFKFSVLCACDLMMCSFLFLPPLAFFNLSSPFSLCFPCPVLCGSVIACPREKSQ